MLGISALFSKLLFCFFYSCLTSNLLLVQMDQNPKKLRKKKNMKTMSKPNTTEETRKFEVTQVISLYWPSTWPVRGSSARAVISINAMFWTGISTLPLPDLEPASHWLHLLFTLVTQPADPVYLSFNGVVRIIHMVGISSRTQGMVSVSGEVGWEKSFYRFLSLFVCSFCGLGMGILGEIFSPSGEKQLLQLIKDSKCTIW